MLINEMSFSTRIPSQLPAHTARVLVAADVSELDAVRTFLASLPKRTKGQVFIEVATSEDIEVLESPELITIAWLVRETRTGAPGTCAACTTGMALGRAARAWLSEMVTGDVELDGGTVSAVVLGRCPEHAALRDEVAARLEHATLAG